ncbi:Magnesium transporter MgtE [Andreprevotia sp. IGB-42]|nr:Magnesium transporter MgtE [Andreprevotia sp. IGB-42]
MAGGRDRLVACIGACLGMLLTQWISRSALGQASPWFIAPMGASAVLLFAVPASPLAQPWSIVGGNLVAASIGVACAQWIPDQMLAVGCAVALSIGVMFPLRCLHPPSGAVALTAVLGGPAVHQLGFHFVWHPVLLNSLLLAALAILFNNLAGRPYPHRVPIPTSHATADLPPIERSGVSREDLHAVLAQHGGLFDINEADLQEILLQAEMHAHQRRFGTLRCADFMAKDVITVDAHTPVALAYQKLQQHRFSALPVLGEDAQLVGIVSLHDLLAAQFSPDDAGTRVWQVMTTEVITARPEDLITSLVRPFSDGGLHHMPVADPAGRVVGMVTQSDLIAALFHEPLP